MNESTIIHTVPAADALHKVPGFDPLNYLRRTVNAQGEPVMVLEPRCQRLWFRLACPKGRMLLTPLRVTDQLAIFEAKVFFHRDDPTPASSFTSNKTVQETPNYIRAAQDDALKEALDNAGFGIQLCDVTRDPGGEAPSAFAPPPQVKITVPEAENRVPAPSRNDPPPAEETPAAPETPPPAPAQTREERMAEEPEAAPALPEKPAAVPEEPPALPDNSVKAAEEPQSSVVSTILNFRAPAKEAESPREADTEPTDDAREEAEAPKYTDNTPVEEILQVMTMEEARAVVVAKGPNAGLLMEKVAERRPSSLRFFLSPCSNCGNIQKAAASLLIQELDQKKAG